MFWRPRTGSWECKSLVWVVSRSRRVLHEAVRGCTQLKRAAAGVLDGEQAVRPDQGPHTEDALHASLAILAVDLLAQSADVLASVAGAREQLECCDRGARRSVLIGGPVATALLRLMRSCFVRGSSSRTRCPSHCIGKTRPIIPGGAQ